METCIFCKIVRKEAPARVLYEDDQVMVFLDASPLSKGHTLVIPKKHYGTLLDIPSNELVHVTSKIQPIAKTLLKVLEDTTDFNVLQNNGPSASQVVNHIHFHIIPRPAGSLSWLNDQAIKRVKMSKIAMDELCKELKEQCII
ncbi:unnamed protein product [Mucor hiemalis]